MRLAIKHRIKLLLIFLFFSIIYLSGCLTKVSLTSEEEPTLSERQKEILQNNGLPTDYDSLTPEQQRSITAIEEMLSYIEDKYGEEFTYSGYVDEYGVETLTVYPSGEHTDFDMVTVTRKNDYGGYIYEDDYPAVFLREDFESYLAEYFHTVTKDVIIFSNIYETNYDRLPEDGVVLDGMVKSRNTVFLPADSMDSSSYDVIGREFQAWMQEHSFTGTTQLIFIDRQDFSKLSRYNYSDYLMTDSIVFREDYTY